MKGLGFIYPTSIYPGGKMKESYSYWEVETLVQKAYDIGVVKTEERIVKLIKDN